MLIDLCFLVFESLRLCESPVIHYCGVYVPPCGLMNVVCKLHNEVFTDVVNGIEDVMNVTKDISSSSSSVINDMQCVGDDVGYKTVWSVSAASLSRYLLIT